MICRHLKIEYSYTKKYIDGYDFIYSSGVNCNGLPLPKLYGPGFGTFPTKNALSLRDGIYIQPSEWAKDSWSNMKNIPIHSFPFPVEMEKFKSVRPLEERQEVILYYKHRNKKELVQVFQLLKDKNIRPIVIKYGKYKERYYLECLQKAKYMIFLGGHESQGFALQEALSCDVPLLVWNVRSMNQERAGYKYDDIPATSIPYWDERCGEFFHDGVELEPTFNKFLENLENYKPRDYVVENLSVERCGERFLQLFEEAKKNFKD